MPDETDNLHSPDPASPRSTRLPEQPALPDAQPAPLHPPGARKRKWKWRWLVLALVVLFIAIFFGVRRGGNSPSKAAPPPPPVAISTATVTEGDIGVYVNALGTVTPINTVSITSRVLGSITSV